VVDVDADVEYSTMLSTPILHHSPPIEQDFQCAWQILQGDLI
jgi:hypothetical protein